MLLLFMSMLGTERAWISVRLARLRTRFTSWWGSKLWHGLIAFGGAGGGGGGGGCPTKPSNGEWPNVSRWERADAPACSSPILTRSNHIIGLWSILNRHHSADWFTFDFPVTLALLNTRRKSFYNLESSNRSPRTLVTVTVVVHSAERCEWTENRRWFTEYLYVERWMERMEKRSQSKPRQIRLFREQIVQTTNNPAKQMNGLNIFSSSTALNVNRPVDEEENEWRRENDWQ